MEAPIRANKSVTRATVFMVSEREVWAALPKTELKKTVTGKKAEEKVFLRGLLALWTKPICIVLLHVIVLREGWAQLDTMVEELGASCRRTDVLNPTTCPFQLVNK
jgi:hypothetical protein